jgi:hypothetical protein
MAVGNTGGCTNRHARVFEHFEQRVRDHSDVGLRKSSAREELYVNNYTLTTPVSTLSASNSTSVIVQIVPPTVVTHSPTERKVNKQIRVQNKVGPRTK